MLVRSATRHALRAGLAAVASGNIAPVLDVRQASEADRRRRMRSRAISRCVAGLLVIATVGCGSDDAVRSHVLLSSASGSASAPETTKPNTTVATTFGGSSGEPPVATATTAPPRVPRSEPEPGDEAVWFIGQDNPPLPSGSSVSVVVTRLGCHGGVTGQVLEPGVILGSDSIAITFTVEPAAEGTYTCPGNDLVPYVVDVGEPIGPRSLVDGACLPGGGGANTSFCSEDAGIRWSP